MFRLVAQVPIFNAHSPFDGPPDAFAGNGIGTLLHRTLNVMKAVYSFAVNGGAVLANPLLDDLGNSAILPPGAIIFESFSQWPTAMVGSNNAAISVATSTAADLLTSTAKTSLSGLLAGTPVNTVASAIALGATAVGYQIYLNIQTAVATAGIGNIYVWYVL